jgi:DNA repair exonuclease SbcCD ATPase subunit
MELEFQSRLNLVFAPNEGGKSTFQRFLVGLLYGQLRSDLKVQRRLDSWVEQYKPWQGSAYGGILWCRLADGREVEIHRSFGREETRIEIRTSTGEDITKQYEQQRNGDVLFARFHFGLPKELFESVGMIRENKVAEIQGYEIIRDRIANLAQSGDEELSIQQSMANIQDALDYIGSERAPTKPYKQALDSVQALQAERKAVDERRTQFQNWIEERSLIAEEISRLERELSKIEMTLLLARRREMTARVRSLEETEKDLCSLRAEIESLGARADFPADTLEELNQLVGAHDNIAKHLSEVRSDKEAALAQRSRAESERQELVAYASLAVSAEAEKITEWFVSYLSISLQKDGLQKTLIRLQEEIGALERRLNELGPALRDPKTDWQRIAREAAEDEQTASSNCAALAERMVQERSNLAAARRKALNRRILAGALLVLAAAPSASRLLAGFNRFSRFYDIGLGVGFAVISGILLLSALKSAKACGIAKQMLLQLEAELNAIREEGSKKRKKFNEVMKSSGFHEPEEFLAAAKRCEQNLQKLSDLQARLAEAEHQRDQLQAQSGDIYRLLKEGLAKVGLACSPGNLKFQIDLLRANLRRFRELDAFYSSCMQKAGSLKSEDSALTEEYNAKRSRIQSLLNQAQVETPEKFREECFKRQKLLELLEKEASLTREFQRLAGNLTLLQWKDQLRELMEQPVPRYAEEELTLETRIENSEDYEPYLPYLPAIADVEEQEKRIAARLSSTREEYARAVERINQAFQNFRPSCEIDEDLAIAERSFRELEMNRLALGIALETIENLSRQQQEVLAPQLNAAVEQRFLRLCGRRYEEVKIDPDFQIWLREADTGELRLAERLSRGTQDQLYFSMRFGILDLISNENEPCPGLLDEPFAAYDRTRLGEAFKVLAEEAGRRQLFLFTCREDLLDLARQQEANIIRLTL